MCVCVNLCINSTKQNKNLQKKFRVWFLQFCYIFFFSFQLIMWFIYFLFLTFWYPQGFTIIQNGSFNRVTEDDGVLSVETFNSSSPENIQYKPFIHTFIHLWASDSCLTKVSIFQLFTWENKLFLMRWRGCCLLCTKPKHLARLLLY